MDIQVLLARLRNSAADTNRHEKQQKVLTLFEKYDLKQRAKMSDHPKTRGKTENRNLLLIVKIISYVEMQKML